MGIAVVTRPDAVNVGRPRHPQEDLEALRRVLTGVSAGNDPRPSGSIDDAPQGYPNPDAKVNPLSPGQPDETAHDADIAPPVDHGDNLGVSPMPSKQEHLAALGGAAPGLPPDPKQLSDPMQDPAFRAFVSQRATELSDLRAAQKQAADIRGSLAFKIGGALGAFGGASGAELAQRYEQAGQPVADVLARQKASGDLAKNASADVGLSGEMLKNREAGEANDPDSPYSHAIARLMKLRPDLAQGFRGSMAPVAEKQGQLDVEHEKNAIEKEKTEMDQFAPQPGTGGLYNKHTGAETGGVGGKPLKPQDAARLDAVINGIESVDRVKDSRKEGVLPGFGEYDATLKGEAPALAAADSGTGRASGQNDILKRAPNLYNAAGDTTFNSDRERYVQAARDRIAALKQAGYNVAEQEAHLARLSSGGGTGGMVDVVSPEGHPGQVPADKLDAALKKGFKRVGR